MKWICQILLVGVMGMSPATAGEAPFQVELLGPIKGLRQCQVSFNGPVPARPQVDRIMMEAMRLCRLVDSTHDVQVMAFHEGEALNDAQSTYTYLAFHKKLGCVQRVTNQMLLSMLARNVGDSCD